MCIVKLNDSSGLWNLQLEVKRSWILQQETLKSDNKRMDSEIFIQMNLDSKFVIEERGKLGFNVTMATFYRH